MPWTHLLDFHWDFCDVFEQSGKNVGLKNKYCLEPRRGFLGSSLLQGIVRAQWSQWFDLLGYDGMRNSSCHLRTKTNPSSEVQFSEQNKAPRSKTCESWISLHEQFLLSWLFHWFMWGKKEISLLRGEGSCLHTVSARAGLGRVQFVFIGRRNANPRRRGIVHPC